MLDFLVTNLPIFVCILAGLALLVIEMFTPGFGVFGFSGIVFLIVSVAMLGHQAGALAGVGLLIVNIALVAIILSVALRSASVGRLSKSPLILKETERPEDGYLASNDLSAYVGKKGRTLTALRPSGIAEFDGARVDVVSNGSFILPEAEVIVENVEGSKVVVQEVKTNA